MRLQLVSIPTDGDPLDGLFYTPEHGPVRAAALLFHGNCHNFYTGPSRFMPETLVARGIACLAFNRRGHDMVTSRHGREITGGAFQLSHEALADNRYASDWLASQGYGDPIVIGHSNGGMLAVKHCADHPHTPALVLMSAHRGGRSIVPMISAKGLFGKDRLPELTEKAEAMVAEGRGRDLMLLPGWWWVISAESLIDYSRNNPDALENAPHVRCPVLYLRGDQEPPEIYPAEEFAARAGGPCTVRILPDCDHFYTGQEQDVAELIADWLEALQVCGRLPLPAGER
jgi:pimeloyl-ACP methyl ester carboxylesterase